MKFIDLTGQKYGRLTVLERAENTKSGRTQWLCKCDCGKQTVVKADNLRNGHTSSCGCYSRETAKIRNTTHNKTGTRLHGIWNGMRQRCCKDNCEAYKWYGGRGIKVCDEWLHDFQAFYEWSMSNGYKDDLTLDRIDVNGNYEPSNCRWATWKEQSINTRRNHIVKWQGKDYTISQLSEMFNIPYKKLWKRINKGWSTEKALSTP